MNTMKSMMTMMIHYANDGLNTNKKKKKKITPAGVMEIFVRAVSTGY